MTIGRKNGVATIAGLGCVLVAMTLTTTVSSETQPCTTLGTQPVHRTFDDVPPGAIATTVDAVTYAGFMSECGGSFFCPDDPDSHASRC